MSSRRLYLPRRVAVEAGVDGRPRAVAGVAVEAVREEWLVEDRWWSPPPLRRHYYELVLADGRDVVIFRSAGGSRSAAGPGRWFRQRA